MKNFSGQLLKIRITVGIEEKKEENCDFVDAMIDVLNLIEERIVISRHTFLC